MDQSATSFTVLMEKMFERVQDKQANCKVKDEGIVTVPWLERMTKIAEEENWVADRICLLGVVPSDILTGLVVSSYVYDVASHDTMYHGKIGYTRGMI